MDDFESIKDVIVTQTSKSPSSNLRERKKEREKERNNWIFFSDIIFKRGSKKISTHFVPNDLFDRPWDMRNEIYHISIQSHNNQVI